jgi:hypothetical protein
VKFARGYRVPTTERAVGHVCRLLRVQGARSRSSVLARWSCHSTAVLLLWSVDAAVSSVAVASLSTCPRASAHRLPHGESYRIWSGVEPTVVLVYVRSFGWLKVLVADLLREQNTVYSLEKV